MRNRQNLHLSRLLLGALAVVVAGGTVVNFFSAKPLTSNNPAPILYPATDLAGNPDWFNSAFRMHGWWVSSVLQEPVISNVGLHENEPGFLSWTPPGLRNPWIIADRSAPIDLSSLTDVEFQVLMTQTQSVDGARIRCKLTREDPSESCTFFAIWESHKTLDAGVKLVGVYFGGNRVGLVEQSLLQRVVPNWRDLPLLGDARG